MAHPKKKGTASAVKKAPKRPRNGEPGKRPKKPKPSSQGANAASGEDDDDESDNGPYCLCRGPDDHRWMICCEHCEDWFHGECINLSKDVGESLIERFVCPNCTKGNLRTIYKKTADQDSLNDQLSQDEFMALLNSTLSGLDEEGTWKMAKPPFSGSLPKPSADAKPDEALASILSDEEKEFLENSSKARFQLGEETLLCHKMLTLVELAQERRRAAITAGRFGEDICGYDSRLDTISARDAFAAYVKSSEGEATFKESKLSDPLGEGDEMLPLGIKYQIREMASQAAEVGEEEQNVREAAGERWKRKQAEQNWVEVLE
ncbi:hypothetical protein ACCO45_002114 [Purpureocillium lilacinum]|uniref:Uncharacterized protein n=1 Tax=Purpureocillium lilacinum TaxID=33203 RepID=A0ACC4E8X6_PURLI